MKATKKRIMRKKKVRLVTTKNTFGHGGDLNLISS